MKILPHLVLPHLVTVLQAHDILGLNVSELAKRFVQNHRPIPNQKRAEADQEEEKEAKIIKR